MKITNKVGLWTMASLVAGVTGALAIFWVGPRKIKEKITHLRSKTGMAEIEVDGP